MSSFALRFEHKLSLHIAPRKLVFKLPERTVQLRPVAGALCMSSIVAAFEDDWQGPDSNLVKAWPLIQLTGEIASEGKTVEQQRHKAIAHLHYHLLARPDLYVAHGLVGQSGVAFFAGTAGDSKESDVELPFHDSGLCPLLYALICHIYDPGVLKDPITRITFDLPMQTCLRILTIKDRAESKECHELRVLYPRSHFGTRTQVHAIPNDDDNLTKRTNHRHVRLVKEQHHPNMRFDETAIFKYIHGDGPLLSSVRLSQSEAKLILFSHNAGIQHKSKFMSMGKCFMSIDTIEIMLEVAFDALEGQYFPFASLFDLLI